MKRVKSALALLSLVCSIALCCSSAKPEELQKAKGIIIGRATLDFENYEWKRGREKKLLKVLVDSIDEDDVVDTLEATVDNQGYFFLENLVMDYTYRINRLEGADFKALIPKIEFGFGILDPKRDEFRKSVSMRGMSMSSPCAEPSVLDMRHIALRVKNLKVNATNASEVIRGSISIDLSNSGSLDRHNWFLTTFPKNRWSGVIKLDRDSVYKNREEAAKENEKRKKAAEADKVGKETVE